MRLRGAGIVGIAWLSVLLAGCGGGGSSAGTTHTYVISPAVNGSSTPLPEIYLTVVSPVPIRASLLTMGGKIVGQAQGPQQCAFTKTAHDMHGPGAFLDGKQLTLKVNGTNPLAPLLCQSIKTHPLNVVNFLGG
jgi:hypothetical protein